MLHPELPVLSFLCAVLVLVPLPWHRRAGTVATVAISLWLFFSNLINGINTIIWNDNVRIVVPVWCDITTKFMIGSTVALPAAVFCLCVHLERVSSVRQVRSNHIQKRQRQIFDSILCFGVPAIYMALHYIVQGHRFDIVELFGCRPTTYVSIPSLFLVWVPPLVFSFGSMVLAALAFRNFWIRRITFARHLQTSNSALTPSRYFRLMCMALVQMFLGIFVITYNMWFTMRHGLRPWTGWADVHLDFSRIVLFPLFFIPPKQLTYTFVGWWMIPISSILFFVFFGFGQDAMKEYKACLLSAKRLVFRSGKLASINGVTSLPPCNVAKDMISLPSVSTPASKDFGVKITISSSSISSTIPSYYEDEESTFALIHPQDAHHSHQELPCPDVLAYNNGGMPVYASPRSSLEDKHGVHST